MAKKRPAAVELQDIPWSNLWESVRKASRFVSPKVGLMKSLQQGITRAQDPEFFAMGVEMQDLSRHSGILNSAKAGGGGEFSDQALIATMGEAIERYCTLFFDKEDMVRGTARELGDDVVDVDLIRYFSREQVEEEGTDIPYKYFDEDSMTHWVWGTSLTTGKQRLVPASQVYLNYNSDEDETVPGKNASTGLAAATTMEEAILTALYEVVERDCFTIAWLHRQLKNKITVDDPELLRLLEQRFNAKHPDVDIVFYDITLDIPIPSIFAVMKRPAEFGPALCVTSVSRLSMREAVHKGLRELGQELPYIRFLRDQYDDWEPREDYKDLVTFDSHFTLYSKRPDLAEQAMAFCDTFQDERLLSDYSDDRTGRPLGDIQRCVDVLAEHGYEVIVVDITTEDVRELDWSVVRVVVPGLVPLYGNHNRQYRGVPRLWSIGEKMGWAKNGWDPKAGLNPFPHPFP